MEIMSINAYRCRDILGVFGIIAMVICPVSAASAQETETPSGTSPAANTPTTAPAATTTTTVSSAEATGEEEPEEESFPLSAKLSIALSVGANTFMPGERNQPSVSTSFTPSLRYKLTDAISLSAGWGLSWYQVLDYGTSYATNTVLWSDPYLSVGYSGIWSDEDLGLRLSGGLRVYGGASLGSQIQTRRITLRPSLNFSWTLEPVSISYTLSVAKHFNESTRANLDCTAYSDPELCAEGRGSGPGPMGSFESERRGGAFTIPGAGVTSFYVSNSIILAVDPMEGLSLSLGVSIYNYFGYSSLSADDEYASDNAKAGRNQTDRMIWSLGVSYQAMKYLSVYASMDSDTTRPFGDEGDSFVVFDFERGVVSFDLGITLSY